MFISRIATIFFTSCSQHFLSFLGFAERGFENQQPFGMLIFLWGSGKISPTGSDSVRGLELRKKIRRLLRRFFLSAELIRRSESDCPSPRQSPHFTE
ncbi:hypothetical protein N399_24745 (plasmid) [Bacillus licheniformis CG-B52]|nr:hypothetical protein N399_24745 [Bacillus licheniformis CG-B52]PSS47687.1 hypothetical protein C6399_23030 [Bacillus licheniformis]